MEFDSKAVSLGSLISSKEALVIMPGPVRQKAEQISVCSEGPNQEASGGYFRAMPVKASAVSSQGPVP